MLAKSKGNEMKLQKVDQQQRKELANSAQKVHDFREQRQKLESGSTRTEASSAKKEPAREKLPKSPVVAQAPELALQRRVGLEQSPVHSFELCAPLTQYDQVPHS